MSEHLPAPDPSLFRSLRVGDRYQVGVDARLARIFATTGGHPASWNQFRTFGPLATGRFDHHMSTEPGRGIWYGALNQTAHGRRVDALLGAVAETCADTHTIDRAVNGRSLVLCSPDAPLVLLRLDSGWLSAAHGSAAIFSGPRDRAQVWSRAIYDRYPDVDGLYYPSSNHTDSACVALYERAADRLTIPRLLRPLTEPGLSPFLERVSTELGWLVL